MIGSPTVLVLGAGASKPYGFPTGWELRQQILILDAMPAIADPAGLAGSRALDDLIRRFGQSDLSSIDAYLGVNDGQLVVGKRAIAAILMDFERQSQANGGPSGDWYAYLWNRIASGHSWDQLDFSNLGIITFNYDRSLEVYLVKVMRMTFDKSESDAIEKLKQLRIVHVYGSLGSIEPSDGMFLPFGARLDLASVVHAADRMHLMPQARDNSPEFDAAKAMLLNAHRICFLGFGFDATNLRRLGGAACCGHTVRSADGNSRGRQSCGSAMGMTPGEIAQVSNLCGLIPHSGVLIDGDCWETLRATQVLA